MFTNIQKAKLTFPKSMSDNARDFINKLLDRDHTSRIGSRGIEEIKAHKFLKDVDWQRVYSKRDPVPIPQPTKHAIHVGVLDSVFDEQVVFDKYFPGWDYYSTKHWDKLKSLLFVRRQGVSELAALDDTLLLEIAKFK
jgi:serine/threonine protein kinase